MKSVLRIVGLIGLVSIIACNPFSLGYKYDQGSLPETPFNLTDFNTTFDDYNSSAPTLGDFIPFCFSTNRNTNGLEFDIIYKPLNVTWDKSTGELTVTDQYENWQTVSEDYEILNQAITKIRTSGDEFGPYLDLGQVLNELDFTLMYSSNESGNSQIYFVSNTTEPDFSEPKEVEFLNSEFEDMYPTFNSDRSRIYFCSNRDEGNFDFYYIEVDPEKDMETLLSEEGPYEIIKDETLSSSADDKCPFIFKDKLVFASDRAGGEGGFDLYYCTAENDGWSEPQNFGETINTEFDEFRPILLEEWVTEKQTMMVFSSNRTGGLGGFDLYFVGVDED